MIKERRKSKESPNTLHLGLTQQKLQFLLPSSKELLLVNPSFNYKNSCNTSKVGTIIDRSSILSNKQNKLTTSNDFSNKGLNENKRVQAGIINNINQGSLRKKISLNEGTKKSFIKTYKTLVIQSQNKNECFGCQKGNQSQECIQMTSLSNIVLLGQQKAKIAEDFFEKEKMLERISKLEEMMLDIINGKIKIRRASSSESMRKSKIENRVSFRGPYNLTRERSKTEMKSTSKSLVKRDSRKKLTIQEGMKMAEENAKVLPPIKKVGILSKKPTLKITQDYRPIRETIKQPLNSRRGSIQDQRNQVHARSASHLKLKLRPNFQPKIINL